MASRYLFVISFNERYKYFLNESSSSPLCILYVTNLRRNMLYFYKLIIKVQSLPSFSFEMKKINMTKPFVWWQSSHNAILQFVIVGFPLLSLSVLDCIVWFLLSSVPLQICLFCALPTTFINTKLTNNLSYKGFHAHARCRWHENIAIFSTLLLKQCMTFC